MAMFISDNSDSSPPIGHKQQPASSSLEGNAPLSRSGGEQSSRYENVASSVAPSHHRPSCPEAFLLHRLSSPRSSILQLFPALPTPPLSPGALSNHSRSRRALSLSRPGTCFSRAKSFYKHSPLRHFGPWLLLVLYALLGALLFFWLESANERTMLQKENAQLERLRQETLQKLARAGRGYLDLMAKYGRQVLIQFERDLARTKSPEALAWDFWGALFYVQTVFTTIGYGNITPRTKVGQAMSILYAIIGIPLVLALLSQTSKKMTFWLSQKWISYRRTVRKHVKRKKPKLVVGQREAEEGAAGSNGEEGQNTGQEEEEEATTESRTIPVWLALTIVGGYVCTIAAIFLVWESRHILLAYISARQHPNLEGDVPFESPKWSYFTSFYFICISCLTIGLGDVVPDHPHMLILMFVFVIFGLSFVSMLISVIQIKMEEWLYRMLIRMQKEYQKALDGITDPAERERVIAQMFEKEPWYLRDLAPLCISEKQSAKLDALADKFERVMLDTNTRAIQTDDSFGSIGPKATSEGRSEDELMRTALEEEKSQQKEWSGPKGGQQSKMASGTSALSRTGSFRSANSVSDATSLPMDPASVAPRPCGQTQTEEGIWQPMSQLISQEAQTVGSPPPARKKTVEKGIGTEKCKVESRGVGTMEQQRPKSQTQGTQMRPTMTNKRVDTDGLVGRRESGISTEPAAKMECREVQTVGILKKKGTKGRLARADSIDEDRGRNNRGVQSSPPSLRHCKTQTDPSAILDYVEMVEGPSQLRERSESIQVVVGDEMEDLMDLAYPERRPAKQDLVIQTDDSYLRIARRLDNLRTAKSEINIYCTGVGIPKRAPGRRKSLRFLEPAVQQIRDSFRRHGKGGGDSSPMSDNERKNDEEAKEGTTTRPDRPTEQQSQSLSPMPVAKRRKHVRLPPET